MQRTKTTKFVVAVLSLASMAVLTACGGGNSGQSAPSTTSSTVRVYGDSLADSGTFGFKATIQVTGNYIFPERIAMQYGQTLCSYYAATGADSFMVSPAAGCTSYAVAGGRISNAALVNPTTNKKHIIGQMVDGSTKAFGATELVIIDGGGNDAADLVGAFLAAQQGSTASLMGLFMSQLTPTQLAAISLSNPATVLNAGNQYMVALADKFYDAVNTNVLSKGANRVMFANIPDITLTPRFQMVLGSIKASQGAATAQALQAAFQGWVSAFNAEFAAKAAAESRIAIVDIYSNFQDEVANPARYTLSNVKDASCPITGVGSDGLPTYNFPSCTAAAAASGWQSYLFADGFHPTPYGHQLASQLISRTLAQKGWL
ncbi:SGNH/GDSL hydrolase family protein [Burkholderiaceae bacterium UC74_6]